MIIYDKISDSLMLNVRQDGIVKSYCKWNVYFSILYVFFISGEYDIKFSEPRFDTPLWCNSARQMFIGSFINFGGGHAHHPKYGAANVSYIICLSDACHWHILVYVFCSFDFERKQMPSQIDIVVISIGNIFIMFSFSMAKLLYTFTAFYKIYKNWTKYVLLTVNKCNLFLFASLFNLLDVWGTCSGRLVFRAG